MTSIEYRLITSSQQADPKSLAAITVLDNGEPEKLAENIVFFRRELESLDPRERLLVAAFAGAELVGFCRFLLCPPIGTWWCRGLEVAPERRRRGIGARLTLQRDLGYKP